ncbi:hypothetical protein B6N25_16770 [Sphingobacteriales bacterium TSM_CSS]|nr:hypothetical protein B6N25_16770 [Sphingobacteriales bacterium TSM_CSS]
MWYCGEPTPVSNTVFDSPLQIFDDFGNTYDLPDVAQPANRMQLLPCDFDAVINGANFNFEVDFYDPSGVGFNAGTPAATAARNVVCQVLTDLSFMLDASPNCNGSPPTLRIQIQPSMSSWSPMGYVLGMASAYYYNYSTPNGTKPGYVHNSVWRTINGGEDPTSYPFVNGDSFYHGFMRFNFHPNINWNFDMTNTTWTNTFNYPDFYQVVLHEVTHMLGISSLIAENGASKFQPIAGGYTPPGTGLYTRYDKYLHHNFNLPVPSPLLNNTDNCYNITFTPPATDLIEDCYSIRFLGTYSPVADLWVYSPGTFVNASSLSHFSNQFSAGCDNTPYLMRPSIDNGSSGYAIRRPTNEEVEALCAIGYHTEPIYGDGTLPFHTSQNGIPVPVCGSIAAGVDDEGLNCHDGYYFSACDFPVQILISDILANDIGVNPTLDLTCISAIVGGAIFTTSSTAITITNAGGGLNVLSYIPTSSTTGEAANTTFIYFYVTPCIEDCDHVQDCNMVCNPTVDGSSSCTLNYNTYPNVTLYLNDLSNCAFDGWYRCHESPNYWPDISPGYPLYAFPNPGTGCIGQWAKLLQFTTSSWQAYSEITANTVHIEQGKKYILSFYRTVAGGLILPNYNRQLDNLYIDLAMASDNYCDYSYGYLNLPLSGPQHIYHETNIPPLQPWRQAIQCFTADQDYDQLLVYGLENLPTAALGIDRQAYYLFDDVIILPDGFAEDTTILVPCCNPATLVGDSCNIIPNVFYTWQQQLSYPDGEWVTIPDETDPIYTTPAICGDTCQQFRLIRNINTESPDFPITGNFACLIDTAYFTLCPNCCPPITIPEIADNDALSCCLDTILFTLAPNSAPYVTNNPSTDNRPAYIVTASGTWTPAANDFVSLGLVASGSNIHMDVDLIIPADVNLTISDMTLFFSPNTRILVQRGGSLTLNSIQGITTLTGLCNSMWQGIQAEGPGLGTLRNIDPITSLPNYGMVTAFANTHIENAIIGIAAANLPLIDVYNIGLLYTNNPIFNPGNNSVYPTLTAVLLTAYINYPTAVASSGGVCRVFSQTTFNNCFHGVNLCWYNNASAPVCTIENAVFTSNNLLYPFINVAAAPRTEAGVYLANYRNLEIATGNTFAGLKYGVRAEEANSILIRQNSFNNCSVGVSAASFALNPLASFYKTIENNFNDCRTAMQFSGTSMHIGNNNINTLSPADNSSIGIFVRGCHFDIQPQNTFNNCYFGCILMNNGLDPSTIKNNDFNNNVIGVWAFGNNGFPFAGGVQITCNRFDNGAIAIAVQDYIVGGALLTVGSLDNQGDCTIGNQNPADNVFNQTPGLPSIFTDIMAQQTGGTFTYFHRADIPGIAQFMPTITGNVTNSQCVSPPDSPEENCGNRNLLSDDEIRGLDVTGLLNREMLRKATYYKEEGTEAAAIDLLQSVNNEYAQRLLLNKCMDTNNAEGVTQILAALPNTTPEQQHYRRTAQILWGLQSQNRTVLQLTPQEETDLRAIAAQYSPASFNAQTMLLTAYGEEHPALLPDFPAFLDTAFLHQVIEQGVNFKNEKPVIQQQAIGVLYPNPAQNIVYMPYHLSDKQNASFELYNCTGQLIYSQSLIQTGLLQYNTTHLPNGIYFYHVKIAGEVPLISKLVLVH